MEEGCVFTVVTGKGVCKQQQGRVCTVSGSGWLQRWVCNNKEYKLCLVCNWSHNPWHDFQYQLYNTLHTVKGGVG